MLEPIRLKKTNNSPEVILDKQQGIFHFKGRSIQEDTMAFYYPIIEWINLYAQNPNPTTEIVFEFDYLNSSSIKRISRFLNELETVVKKGKQVKVIWRCEPDDEDMQERAEEILVGSSFVFEIISSE